MEIRQWIRILVFGYFSFLPNLLSYWITAVLPQVIEYNLKVEQRESVSRIGGLYFAFYFFGIIAGTFAWPYLLRLCSKNVALLLGLVFQGVFTALTGQTIDLTLLFAARFATGFFNNVNTVGKDFIFEFAKPAYRQYAFSIKSCFTVAGIFIGPLIGFYMYVYFDSDFGKCTILLFWLYMIAALLFVLLFMVDMRESVEGEAANSNKAREHSIGLHEEEVISLVREEQVHQKEKQKGIPEVLSIMWHNKILRNFSIVYFLTNGIFTTRNFVLVFFLESTWGDQGLGVSSKEVSMVNFYSFFFCLAFLLVSPRFVPSRVSYLSMVKQIIIVSVLLFLLPPLLRDLLPNGTHPACKWTIYLTYGVSNFFNPKLFSPFINFFMNNEVDKYSRTALNSITFVTSVVSAAVIMTAVSPLLSISLHHPFFSPFKPWSKYLTFVVLDLLLVLNLFYLSSKQFNDSRREEKVRNTSDN